MTLAPEETGGTPETLGPLTIGAVVPGIDQQRFDGARLDQRRPGVEIAARIGQRAIAGETVLAELGQVNIRRAYGNWAKPALSNWSKHTHRFGLQPVQQFDMTRGKNATDMAMTIDAIDLRLGETPAEGRATDIGEEGGDIARHLFDRGAGAVGVFHLAVAQRCRHGDLVAGEVFVVGHAVAHLHVGGRLQPYHRRFQRQLGI